jgi:hypothetical protein
MDLDDPILNLPWSTTPLHMGVYIQTGAKVLGILIVAFVVIRLAHVFVGGIARALLNRENLEGTAEELSAAELKPSAPPSSGRSAANSASAFWPRSRKAASRSRRLSEWS